MVEVNVNELLYEFTCPDCGHKVEIGEFIVRPGALLQMDDQQQRANAVLGAAVRKALTVLDEWHKRQNVGFGRRAWLRGIAVSYRWERAILTAIADTLDAEVSYQNNTVVTNSDDGKKEDHV